MTAAELQRAVEVHATRRLRSHEAAHAAIALLAGLEVREVHAPACRADGPTRGHAVVVVPPGESAARRSAISTIAGPLENEDPRWPPTWPPDPHSDYPDERDLAQDAAVLGLDRDGYHRLVQEALALTASRDFERLRDAIAHGLETSGGHLGEAQLRRIKTIVERTDMQHVLAKATVQATDVGDFVALAATYSVDRQGDRIVRGAFSETLDRWRALGKMIPLHWNHSPDPELIIGWVDPALSRETDEGLRVEGHVDIDASSAAREAWRSMRNGSMSLSFGYKVDRSRKRDGQPRELLQLDLFEVSIAPAPANADTRVVSMKSAASREHEEIASAMRREIAHLLAAGQTRRAETMRQKMKRFEREHSPITVATFDC